MASDDEDRLWAKLALIWLMGACLRLAVLALPPVLNELVRRFHMLPSDVGVLTALPPLLFSVAAIPGAMLIGRLGPLPCLLGGLVLTTLGAAARGVADGVVVLEIATGVMCFGVAVMQPAMPSIIRVWTPRRAGLAGAVYTFGLLFGEILPVTFPVRTAFGLSEVWRSQLLLWAVPSFVTAVAIVLFDRRGSGSGSSARGAAPSPWPEWVRGDVWWMGIMMGSIGAAYLTLNGFIPIWAGQGGEGHVGQTLTALNLAQLPAAIAMLFLAERLAFRGSVYALFGAGLLAGSVCLAIGPPSLQIPAACLAGFCSAVLLALVITLQPLIAEEHRLPGLSAGTFTIGFGIAFVVALGTGWLERLGAGVWSIGFVAFAALAIVALGLFVRRVVSSEAASASEPA